MGIEALESRIALATSIWSGAVDGLWSNAGNWDTPPAEGSDLVFPDTAANRTNTNDITPVDGVLTLSSITVSGAGYAIGGNGVEVTGLLDASYATGSSTVNAPVDFTGTGTVKVDQSGADLVLGGSVVGPGTDGLIKQGPGTLTLTSNNQYTGSTTIQGGVLGVDGTQGGSPVIANAGTTLQGSGTVGPITATGATVSPGGGSPAILTTSGGVTLNSSSNFAVNLNGNTPGTGYDQLTAAGPINLGGATLQPALSGYTPAGTDQLVILNNTGSAAVTGTFAGLAQGATVTVGGSSFRISYAGGDGNDVVLTPVLTSTTTLAASSNTSVFGQGVTLTANVTAADPLATDSPTGTVQFFNGTTSLGTATLSGGTATLNTTVLPVGANSVTAQYQGDADFGTSTSTPTTVTVAQASTSTSLSVAPTSSVTGQPVTLTANIAAVSPGGGSPTGTVEFFSGTTSLGTAPIGNGVATLTTSTLALGGNSVTAQYQGTTSYSGSTSAAVTATVAQATTTTSLSSTPNPSSVGQPTTLKATVAAGSPGSGTPTGSVEFFNGATSLGTAPLVAGVASLDTSALPLGTSTITAQYQGDANYTTSTSAPLSQTVSPATNTSLTTSTTAITFGGEATLTATVAPAAGGSGTPTGTVIFMSGSTPLGTAALNANGVAVLKTSALPGGNLSITAQYQGDTNFGGSTSAPVTVAVAKATTTSTLSASPNPSSEGNIVTIQVTVASSSTSTTKPSGTVQFFDGAVMIGTATVSSGVATFTTSSLTLGSHQLSAQYQGDGNYESSTAAAVTQNVNRASTTNLTVTPTTSVFGQSVTLTANVSAANGSGQPTGTVEFFRSGVSLGTATLTNGVATLSTTSLTTGTNLVTAQYKGDATFGVSSSQASGVTVAKSDTSTALTVVPNTSNFSQEVTLTATVTATSPGSGTPTGPVQFSIGSTVLGVANLVNGVATFRTTALPLGTSTVTARYASDANYKTSTSSAVSTTVNQSNSAVTVTATPTNPVAFEAVTLRAVVAASNQGTGTPTGTVQFFSNGKPLGSATLSGGIATLITTDLTLGANNVTAVYQGDSNFTTATSQGLSIVSGTQTEQFLNQVYINAAGRPATLDELDFYRTQLTVGIPRQRVVTRIVNSLDGKVNAVQTVYRTFLGRAATNRELVQGLSQVGKTQGFAVEIQVLGSRDYYRGPGGGTIDGYLTALYSDVLGTAIPSATLARQSRRLRQGASRASVASSLVLSQPGKTAFVGFLYQQFFGTAPSPQQSARSVGILNQGGSVDQVVIDLLSSNAFYAKFAGTS